MVAMLAWSAGTLILSKNKVDINPYYAIGWQMLFGSVQLALLAGATGQLVQISSIPLSSWLTIGYLVSVGSILTFSAFIYSIRHLPASLASLYAYINPLVAMVTGALVLNESITLNLIIGAVITVVGVYIVNHSIKKET
jgi:drug/metabolite transporter (DMT)-like permease